MRDRRLYWAATALLALIGITIRAWGIARDPLWLDEAYTAYAADHGLAFLWQIVPLYETHPPFYYTLVHAWVQLCGNSLTALRLFGLLAGIATLPVMMLAAGDAGRWLGWDNARRRGLRLAAFGLAVVSLAFVEMARQVRPYPVMILIYAVAILLMLRTARRVERGDPVRSASFIGYLAAVEATLWLHNLGPLYALALTLALAIALLRPTLRRADWAWLIGGHALVGLLYLPGLLMLRAQATTWVASTWLRFRLDWTLFDRLQTLYAAPGWPGLASLVLAGLAMAGLARMRNGRRLAAMLLLLTLLPVTLAILLSMTIAPVFITRTMTPTAVPALLLLAIGAVGVGRTRIVGIGAAILLGAAMLGADIQARTAGPMQNWYRTIDWLAQHVQPGDQIFAYPNEGKLPLSYALRDKRRTYPIRAVPTDVPSLEVGHGTHPTGTRGVSVLPRSALRKIAQEPATQAIPTIWLLRLGPETFDPGDVFLQEVHRDRYVVRHWTDGPIDIIGLRRRPRS